MPTRKRLMPRGPSNSCAALRPNRVLSFSAGLMAVLILREAYAVQLIEHLR